MGGGISGLSVSVRLLHRGCDVTLVDSGVNHSSRVAAGMINPLVFRRMNRSWRAGECLDSLRSFYPDLESETATPFFSSVPLRRIFSSDQERRYWLEKQHLAEFREFMNVVTAEDDAFDVVPSPFGSGRVKNVYAINTRAFLPSVRSYVARHGRVITSSFDYNSLSESSYNGVNYDGVIFCEGYQGVHNPWFQFLPLSQTKGEIITIRATTLPDGHSLNRKCFMLPLGNQTFKVGSTYNWNDPTTQPTEEGKQQILDKLSYLIREAVTVLDHEAGIRPTTPDRRAFIGTHPEHPNYHVFNGLGTKGYLIAPLLSEEFVSFLLDGTPLHEEVRIKRFYPGR